MSDDMRGLAGAADPEVADAFGVFYPGETGTDGSSSKRKRVGCTEDLLEREGLLGWES